MDFSTLLSSQGLSHISDIVAGVMTVLGGLRVIAQYTPWQADDHFFAVIEAPLKWIADALKNLTAPKP